MPDASEFEEKEYEHPLYQELVGATPSLWTPGQVLEGHLGFDAALSVANSFWTMVDRPQVEGVRLARYGLSPMDPQLASGTPGARDELPDFSLNLFLQVKRPHEYRSLPQPLVDLGLRTPTWFFEITPHQQELLQRLAAHLGAHADVSYACAAFATKKKLFSLYRERGLVPHSTFPPVSKLVGHARWAYDSGGARGVGFSDPEAIDAVPLLDRVAKLSADHPRGLPRWSPPDEERLTKGLEQDERRPTAQSAEEIHQRGEALVPQFQRIWDAISTTLEEMPTEQVELANLIKTRASSVDERLPAFTRLVAQISTATAHLGIAWLVVGPTTRER